MNCPICNTINDPANQFCISCGGNIHGPGPTNRPVPGSAKSLLGILTSRTIISLFSLMILNMILTDLAFIKEFDIPDFDLTTPVLVTTIIYIVAIVLLVKFAVTVRGLWPQSYPQYGEVVHVFTAVIYIVVLSTAYKMTKPLILAFADDYTPLMLLQLVCILVTVVLVGRISTLVYQRLPFWLSTLKNNLSAPSVQFTEDSQNIE